jgi:DUF438 domain-containing protein
MSVVVLLNWICPLNFQPSKSVTLNLHELIIINSLRFSRESLELSEDKKAQIKEAIRQLHAGVPPEQVKEKFRSIFEGTDSLEIAKIEEELAKEGMKRDEMRKLCDVHMSIFKEQLEKQMPNMKPSQPISILMEEHKIMLQLSEKLISIANKILKITDLRYATEEIHQVEHVTEDFTDSEKHYLREENVLFPIVEKHGITEPPAIMWMEHDQIREQKKKLQQLKDVNDQSISETETASPSDLLATHFIRENNILFPAAMSVVTEAEWIGENSLMNQTASHARTDSPCMQAKTDKHQYPQAY